MALRFYSEFTSERANTWRVNIYDRDFSDTAEEFNCSAPGFSLEYFGGRDIYAPLMPSACSVYAMVQTAAFQTFLANLSDFVEGRFYIELRLDPDGTNALHWLGLLTPESVRIPDQARPFGVELKAICGLATLSRSKYDDTLSVLSTNSALDHALTALAAIPDNRQEFANAEPYLMAPIDIVPNTGVTGDTFFNAVHFGVSTYDPQLGLRELESNEEVLTQLCLMMNARLFQYKGRWMFLPVSRFVAVSTLFASIPVYDKNGTALSSENIYPSLSINQTARHRLGGEFYYLPAVSRISRQINYFGNTPFAGSRQLYPNQFRPIGHTTTGEPTSYSVSGSVDTNIAADNTLKVKGYCFVRLPWQYTSVPSYDPQSRVSRWRVELTIRCGTLYLKRNITHAFNATTISADDLYDPPGGGTDDATIFNLNEPEAYTWTTNSASRVHFWTDIMINGHAQYEGDPVTDQIDFEFLTPTLGSAENADISITMQARGYNGEASASNPDASAVGPGLYNNTGTKLYGDLAVYVGDGTDNGDVLTFAAELDNGATEQLSIEEGYYAEGPSDDIYNFSSAALVDTLGANIPNFTSTLTQTGTALNTLLCLERLEHFGKAQELYRGDFQSGDVITPLSLLLFESKKWLPVDLKHEGSSDLYDIELTAVQALGTLDPDGVTPVRSSTEPIHSAAGSIGSVQEAVERGRRDLMSITADIQTDVDNALRTTDANGGASTILLQYLGDVKISSPSNGQVLEYNTTAGRWANVTPSGGGGASALDDLTDVDAGSATDGQVLKYNAANSEWTAAEDKDTFPKNHVTWMGAGANTSALYTLSANAGWISWTTLAQYWPVSYDPNSIADANDRYIVPTSGLYEMNIFAAFRNTSATDATEIKLLVAPFVDNANGVLCARTTKDIYGTQFDGVGGTCVFEATAQQRITPAIYYVQAGSGGSVKLVYSNQYLHAAIRQIA